MYDELGARYIPIAVPEITKSLKVGLIDGGIAPHAWMLATQAFLYTQYFIETPFFYSPAAIFVDEKQLRDLEKKYPPGAVRELVDYVTNVVVQGEKDWRAQIRDYEKKCIFAIINSGRESVDLLPSKMDIIHAAARNVEDALVGKAFSAEFLHKITAELKKYRERGQRPNTVGTQQ